MNDLKTHLLDLAQRNPNMRAYRIAQEIKKFETTQQMAEENYRRRYPPIHLQVSPPRRNWFSRMWAVMSAPLDME